MNLQAISTSLHIIYVLLSVMASLGDLECTNSSSHAEQTDYSRDEILQ